MSNRLMDWVRRHSDAKGAAFHVLVAIADHANDEGTAFPSEKTLAIETRTSVSSVTRALVELEKLGELEVKRHQGPHSDGPRRVHLYRVLAPAGRTDRLPKRKAQGAHGDDIGEVRGAHGGHIGPSQGAHGDVQGAHHDVQGAHGEHQNPHRTPIEPRTARATASAGKSRRVGGSNKITHMKGTDQPRWSPSSLPAACEHDPGFRDKRGLCYRCWREQQEALDPHQRGCWDHPSAPVLGDSFSCEECHWARQRRGHPGSWH